MTAVTQDLNLWINFALNAVLGRLREADALMVKHGDDIRRAADGVMRRMPVAVGELHRGLLLDPSVPYVTDARYTFLSWSEDLAVATWFASTRTVISEHTMQLRPNLRGHVVTLPTPTSRILYHHRWGESLAMLALGHPEMGVEGARQIAWSVRTQREVITDLVDGLAPVPMAELSDVELADLERRFAPPWVTS